MKRSASVVAVGTTALLALTMATALPAEAGTPKWLHVRTTSKVTAYNNGKVVIRPRATASGNRVLSSLRITAYRGGKKVASGGKVRLRAGTYRTVTSGRIRTFKVVSQQRSRRVLHESDYVSAVCRVTRAVDDGIGGTTSTATCKNGYYPRQRPTDTQYAYYRVGAVYRADLWFNDEYVSQRYTAKVRKYGKAKGFSSKKRKLVVRDGGFRKVFTGNGSADTRNFRVPKSSWRVSFDFDCSDYSNMIIWLNKPNGDYVDLVANELGYSSNGSAREHGSGKYYLEVTTDSGCSWRATVR